MTFKTSVVWNKVTEKMPEDGKEYLVWTGIHMICAVAEVYTPEERQRNLEIANDPQTTRMFLNPIHAEEFTNRLINNPGRFKEFGQTYYFDDAGVFWAELPLAPGEENPPSPDPYEGMITKNAYLKKDGEIVGIHAIGYPGRYDWDEIALDGTTTKKTSDFMQVEIWGNVYDENHNMLGRGSFRVFDQFESEVKNWEADGWIRYEGPKKKEKA